MFSPTLKASADLADRKLPFAALDIFEKVVEALDKILAVRLQRRAQDFGIGQDEVGRRDRVGELLGIKVHALARVVIEAFDLGDRVLHPVRGQQVGLLDEVEDLVFLPVLVPEAFVVRPAAQPPVRLRRPSSCAP